MSHAQIVHRLPGRLRLRLSKQLVQDKLALDALQHDLAACVSVSSVKFNVMTCGLLIEHNEAAEAPLLQDFLRVTTGLSLVDMTEAPAYTITEAATASFKVLDRRFRTVSGGWVDSHSVLFLTFIGLAITQVRQGHLIGPALTLFLQAIGFLKSTPGNR